MPKVVIGIHGLGNKPPKVVLQRWWLEAMYEGLKRINKRQVIPRFELVYWIHAERTGTIERSRVMHRGPRAA